MQQIIDLVPHFQILASPHATYTLSGWFGAKDNDPDYSHARACFFRQDGSQIGGCGQFVGLDVGHASTMDKLVLFTLTKAPPHGRTRR